MPLQDHFHLPWSDEYEWEGFHSAWANTIVRHLNSSVLPPGYRASPHVHLGPFVEADIATFARGTPFASNGGPGDGGAELSWSPPQAVQTLEIELPAQDLFEVRIHDDQRGRRLVAAVELVSPGNKDRDSARQAFVTKCAAYLQDQVNLVVVDVVTSRHADMHHDLLELVAPHVTNGEEMSLYCVAYRNRKEQRKWRLDFLPYPLEIGKKLPTVPLWLAGDLSVPLDLERSYEETCQVLRIPVKRE